MQATLENSSEIAPIKTNRKSRRAPRPRGKSTSYASMRRNAQGSGGGSLMKRFRSLLGRAGRLIFTKGFGRILRALNRAWQSVLSFFDMDTPEKVSGASNGVKVAVKGAAKAAVSAMIITLLGSMADNAKEAIGSFVSKSEEKMSTFSGRSEAYTQGGSGNAFASSYPSSHSSQSSWGNPPPSDHTLSQGNFFNENRNPWGNV